MMNYHPEGVQERSQEGLDRVTTLLKTIAGWQTFIFATDRYWHSYGTELLSDKDWSNWLGLHANATCLVSPRYIGQSHRDGYTPLRQVGLPNSPVKNTLPTVVKTLDLKDSPDRIWGYSKHRITSLPDGLLKYPWKIVGQNDENATSKRTSRVLIINELNQVLLMTRAVNKSYGGAWHIPGGKAEGNETPKETAIREIFEETGIHLEKLDPMTHYYSDHTHGYFVTIFTSYLKVDNLVISLDTENIRVGWFSLDEIPDCAFSDNEVIDLLKKSMN